jgi:two-component system chemotaxis response regulator CheB
MSKIRVMIVDDAVVVRKLLTEALSLDPAIEVVATAPNGKLALAKLPSTNPDLMVLDVEMPEMDGLATLTELRRSGSSIPVIMFSSHTQAGAQTTLEALQRGAADFVTKPTGMSGLQQSIEVIREQLVTRIKGLCHRGSHDGSSGLTAVRPPPAPMRTHSTPAMGAQSFRPPELIVIGISTGGPNALAELIPHLPRNLSVPVAIVQHMPPLFTKLLAERLSAKAQIPVLEGTSGMALEPGKAVLAPGDWHMVVERVDGRLRVKLNQNQPENSCRPAVDPLFRSAAEVCGGQVLGVVMTGMGQDGTRGAHAIRDAGGQILVQDEASSVVWGMPGSVVKAGLAHQIVPLPQLAAEILRCINRLT